MKITATAVLAAAAVGIAGFVVYQSGRKLAAVANALNPANNDNVVAGSFEATLKGPGVTLLPGFTLRIPEGSSFGSAIYDLFHPTYDPNEGIRGPLQ